MGMGMSQGVKPLCVNVRVHVCSYCTLTDMGPASFLARLILWILWICRLSVIEGHHHNSRVVAVARFYRCKVHICSCTDWQSSENMTNCPNNFTYATSKQVANLQLLQATTVAIELVVLQMCTSAKTIVRNFWFVPATASDALGYFGRVLLQSCNSEHWQRSWLYLCVCLCVLSHIYVTIDSSCL